MLSFKSCNKKKEKKGEKMDNQKQRLLDIFRKKFEFPNHRAFINTFYPYETWANWYGSTHIQSEKEKYYRVIEILISFLEKQKADTIRYNPDRLKWDTLIENLSRFLVHLINAIGENLRFKNPLQELYQSTPEQQREDGLLYDADINLFKHLYEHSIMKIGENMYNTISACSHCDNDAHLQTECCGRAYCGQECLEADLVEHDLECVDIKLPTWM